MNLGSFRTKLDVSELFQSSPEVDLNNQSFEWRDAGLNATARRLNRRSHSASGASDFSAQWNITAASRPALEGSKAGGGLTPLERVLPGHNSVVPSKHLSVASEPSRRRSKSLQFDDDEGQIGGVRHLSHTSSSILKIVPVPHPSSISVPNLVKSLNVPQLHVTKSDEADVEDSISSCSSAISIRKSPNGRRSRSPLSSLNSNFEVVDLLDSPSPSGRSSRSSSFDSSDSEYRASKNIQALELQFAMYERQQAEEQAAKAAAGRAGPNYVGINNGNMGKETKEAKQQRVKDFVKIDEERRAEALTRKTEMARAEYEKTVQSVFRAEAKAKQKEIDSKEKLTIRIRKERQVFFLHVCMLATRSIVLCKVLEQRQLELRKLQALRVLRRPILRYIRACRSMKRTNALRTITLFVSSFIVRFRRARRSAAIDKIKPFLQVIQHSPPLLIMIRRFVLGIRKAQALVRKTFIARRCLRLQLLLMQYDEVEARVLNPHLFQKQQPTKSNSMIAPSALSSSSSLIAPPSRIRSVSAEVRFNPISPSSLAARSASVSPNPFDRGASFRNSSPSPPLGRKSSFKASSPLLTRKQSFKSRSNSILIVDSPTGSSPQPRSATGANSSIVNTSSSSLNPWKASKGFNWGNFLSMPAVIVDKATGKLVVHRTPFHIKLQLVRAVLEGNIRKEKQMHSMNQLKSKINRLKSDPRESSLSIPVSPPPVAASKRRPSIDVSLDSFSFISPTSADPTTFFSTSLIPSQEMEQAVLNGLKETRTRCEVASVNADSAQARSYLNAIAKSDRIAYRRFKDVRLM